jgi:hypothetical protein
VLTRTDDGSELREEGSVTVDGIRFPKELVTVSAGETGRVVFDEIKVNEEMSADMFQVPMPRINLDAPVEPQPAMQPEPPPALPPVPQDLEVTPESVPPTPPAPAPGPETP